MVGGEPKGWDAEDRLIQITYPGVPGKQTDFVYDGLDRRTAITRTPAGGGSAVTTSYIWCGRRICQARDAANTPTRSYFDEGEYVPGSPGQTYYYAPDQIGSVRRVFESASSAPAYAYDPWGNPLQVTTPLTDFGYAGMFNEPDSGLYLTQYRAYDPVAGRWLSRDPLGEWSELVRPAAYVRVTGAVGAAIAFSDGTSALRGTVDQALRQRAGGDFNSYPTHYDLVGWPQFNSTDLIDLRSGYNLYAYVGGDPISLTDPTGLASGDLPCQGGSCSSGGTWGTTAMYCIGGQNVCRDCAVKILGLPGLPGPQQNKILLPFLIGK